jgi:hypothetical protein
VPVAATLEQFVGYLTGENLKPAALNTFLESVIEDIQGHRNELLQEVKQYHEGRAGPSALEGFENAEWRAQFLRTKDNAKLKFDE